MLRYELHLNGFPFPWKKVCKNLLWRNHHCPYLRLWKLCLFQELFLAYLFRGHRGSSFHTCMMKCILSSDAAKSNWQWHSFVGSVAPDDSHFPLMLSCWCSMHRVRTLSFFFLLFLWQNICCRFFPDVKVISFPIFLNSRFIFELMFGIQGSFFRFLCSQFSVLFSWLFLFFIYCCILLLSFSKVAWYGQFQGTYRLKIFLLLWYISRNISSVLCEGNLGIHFWWC